jgi:hypothetical protein
VAEAQLGISRRRAFDDFNFVRRQFVKLANQLVDLRVGGIDLTLESCHSVIGFRGRELFVKREHPLGQLDHSIVKGFLGRVGEVDSAKRHRIQLIRPDVVVCAREFEAPLEESRIQEPKQVLNAILRFRGRDRIK